MSNLVTTDSKFTKYSPHGEKACVICGKPFVGFSANQKTCSPECSVTLSQRKQRERYRKKRVLKGYNQSGENNNIHKAQDGRRKNWIYTKYRKSYCEYCGTQSLETKLTFVVHHRDGDPTNDAPSNLVTLCHRCHKLVHNNKISL